MNRYELRQEMQTDLFNYNALKLMKRYDGLTFVSCSRLHEL